jgi:hypothetical protein
MSNTYGGTKKLPNVRPHSAVVTKNTKGYVIVLI